jgi:outer membrane lipoprotein-sorting protein
MLPRSVVLTAALAALAPAAGAQTADEVIARSVEARGGLARIRAVQSVRMTGRMSMGEMDMPMSVEMKRPSSFRAEMSLQGHPVVQAYDGQRAWTIPPTGTARPQVLPAEAARQMAQQADIEGPLVDYKAKGSQVELEGKEKLAGSDVWRVKLTRKDGDVEYYLIDARSWLPVRVEATRSVGGRLMQGETTLGDYKESGGWKWPHSIVNSAKEGPGRQTLTFDTIEVNPALEDARFRMPAAAAPTTRR